MNTPIQLAIMVRNALVQPARGVVGMVDDLLKVCREHGAQIDWRTDCYRVRAAGGEWTELIDVPLRKSVFRAILARIAVLCNERTPNSVSPYGGHGELSVSENPPAIVKVTFVNTPEEQRLELLLQTSPVEDVSQQRAAVPVFSNRATGEPDPLADRA